MVSQGRQAEDGIIPESYELVETNSAEYKDRTGRNVRDSDGTVVFTKGKPTGGSALTIRLAHRWNKPVIHLDLASESEEDAIA